MANIHTDEQLLEISKTILAQIKTGVESVWVYFSWGVSKKWYMEYNGMATLALRVTGLYHKGWVYVSLNEASDTYEVRLMNCRHKQKGEAYTDIYCDQLGELIDRIVERGTTTEDEYHKAALKDSSDKMKAHDRRLATA